LSVMLEPGRPKIPAPSASLETLEPDTLWLTTVLLNVSAPAVKMPPPRAIANGRSPLMQLSVMSAGQGSVESAGPDGTARLPVTRLLRIVPVAPGPPSAAGGISMPPPRARNGTGSAVLSPPVTVTPLMLTVGSGEPSLTPIEITGPPPLMIV